MTIGTANIAKMLISPIKIFSNVRLDGMKAYAFLAKNNPHVKNNKFKYRIIISKDSRGADHGFLQKTFKEPTTNALQAA
jgi:hypothetical protein